MRVTTFNVHFGKRTKELASAFLENENLKKTDVLLLQEIESYPHEQLGRAEQIAKILNFTCIYDAARKARKKGTHGLAILSKIPMENVETLTLPFFKLYFKSRNRIAQIAKLETDKGTFYVCNVHLDARLNVEDRIEQLNFVIEKLKTYSDFPIILGGDFNTIPFYLAFKSIPIRMHKQHELVHEFLLENDFKSFTDYEGYTLKKGLLTMKLDHIYCKNATVTNSGVEKEIKLSDHKPVWADVSTVS